MRCLALIPARNEAASLPSVVDELGRACPGLSILIVDDASSDGTAGVLADLERRESVRWLRLGQHLGLGGAMRAGLRRARMLGHDTVVRIDGDGQHPPAEIERLLAPIREGRADAVQGSRYRERSHAPGGAPRGRWRWAGQRVLALGLSAVTGQVVTDPTSGFWAFGPRAVDLLGDEHPTGYPEPELRLFLRRNGLRVAEVPVEMRRRLAGRTSLTLPRAALAVARVVLAMVVVPLRAAEGGRRP